MEKTHRGKMNKERRKKIRWKSSVHALASRENDGTTMTQASGPSALAYVISKCADYYRLAEESEVPNYLGLGPRHFFVAVLSKNETYGESFTRARVHDHLDRQSDVTNRSAVLPGALIKLVSAKHAQNMRY